MSTTIETKRAEFVTVALGSIDEADGRLVLLQLHRPRLGVLAVFLTREEARDVAAELLARCDS